MIRISLMVQYTKDQNKKICLNLKMQQSKKGIFISKTVIKKHNITQTNFYKLTLLAGCYQITKLIVKLTYTCPTG